MIAAVILAAGESSRLGRPKQLVVLGGRSLIRRAVEAARGAGCSPIVVVLGAYADEVRAEIEPLAPRTVVNASWREGMGGSVRTGIAELVDASDPVDAVVLTGCDQPCLSSAVLRRLIEAYRDRRDRARTMVASTYAGTRGTPALFSRAEFDRLLELEGDRGARDLLRETAGGVVDVSWPDGARDIDAEDDLSGLACEDSDAEL